MDEWSYIFKKKAHIFVTKGKIIYIKFVFVFLHQAVNMTLSMLTCVPLTDSFLDPGIAVFGIFALPPEVGSKMLNSELKRC